MGNFKKYEDVNIMMASLADSEAMMVDWAFWHDFSEQDRSWDDFGKTVSCI